MSEAADRPGVQRATRPGGAIGWHPTAHDTLYARTGEATWDCIACCLNGHEARAHDGSFCYAWGHDGRVSILGAPPCMLLAADVVVDITQGCLDQPPFAHLDDDLLRLEADNRSVIYRLTRQPYNGRPSAMTPAVATLFPPYGEFCLAEWPD